MPAETAEECAEEESRGYPTRFEPNEPENDSDPYRPDGQGQNTMTDSTDDMPEAPSAPQPMATALAPYTPEQGVLVKLNPMVEAITLYGTKRVKDMVTTGLTRKQIRDIAHERTMEGTRLRTSIAGIGKVLKQDALDLQRNVNKAVRDSESAIDPIESEWRTLRDNCDREEQEEKERAQREMEEKVSGRANKLTALGISVQIRFVKNQPWALLYAGTTPLTEADLSVFGESLLWSMTDKAFEDRLENVTAIIDAKVREQVAAERELKRLQLDERLRTRTAELQAAEVTVMPEGLRDMEESAYQAALTAARKVITDRQEATARQQQERAESLRKQQEALAQQQEAAATALRNARAAELKSVNGRQPHDDVTDMELDLAAIPADEWVAWMQEQREDDEQRKELARRAEETRVARQRLHEERTQKLAAIGKTITMVNPGENLADMPEATFNMTLENGIEMNRRGSICEELGVEFTVSLYVNGMSAAEFDQWASDTKAAASASALRSHRTTQWLNTPGHNILEFPEDSGTMPEEEWNTLLLECEVAQAKVLADAKAEADAARERMAPDVAALKEFRDAVLALPYPEMYTDKDKQVMSRLSESLKRLLDTAVVG